MLPFLLPDIRSNPTSPIIVKTFDRIVSHTGNTNVICEIDANKSVGNNNNINPINSEYHNNTSHIKSTILLSFKSIYPFIPSPKNIWIIPITIEYINSLIGSLSGTNHNALSSIFLWKNTFDTTVIASPKNPPNSNPHIVVDIPQYINICNDLFNESPILGNFFIAIKHAKNIITP